ncbi:Uncharacterised protein [Mycobacteroides abscessus subsp. abscessus]|nr:Uncharacterised protein [Mycobacteroides abscessus subsp. abscessus]
MATLVVVEHARDGTELDGRQHQQHRLGRVAQHDADHVATPHPLRGQGGGVPIGGGVGLRVGDVLALETQEHSVCVFGGAFGKHPADRPPPLGRGLDAAEDAPRHDRQVERQTGQLREHIGQPDAITRIRRDGAACGHLVLPVVGRPASGSSLFLPPSRQWLTALLTNGQAPSIRWFTRVERGGNIRVHQQPVAGRCRHVTLVLKFIEPAQQARVVTVGVQQHHRLVM